MTFEEIEKRLIEQGTSFNQWARANGFDPRTVRKAAREQAHFSYIPPTQKTFFLLQALSKFIGENVPSGIFAIEASDLCRARIIAKIIERAEP